jgi:hypothetical protein
MPEMQSEKVHLSGPKKRLTLQGLKPRRYSAPARDNVLFTWTGFQAMRGNRMRPRPQWGQGWRKGGQMTVGVKI